MRYILLVLFTLIATFASAQVQYLGSPTTTVRNRGNFVSDSLFYLPKRTKAPSDTGAIRYQISDSALYVWTGSAWRTAGTAGSAITGSGVAGYMPEFTTATNIDTTRLYHSNGRFGIGTTSPANELHVVGNIRLGSSNAYQIGNDNKSFSITNRVTNVRALVIDTANSIFFGNLTTANGAGSTLNVDMQNSSVNVTNTLNVTDTATFTGRGLFNDRVGIGTSTPGNLLHVNGTNGRIRVTGGNHGFEFDNGRTGFVSGGADIIHFYTSGNVRGVFQADGEFLLNTTTDAGAYALQVAGSIYNTTGAVLAASSGSVGIGTASPAYRLDVTGQVRNTTNAYFSTTDGSVGIGTTSAQGKLDVYEPGTVNHQIVLRNGGTYHTGIIGSSSANPLSDANAWGIFGGPNSYVTGISNSTAIALGTSVASFQITRNANLNDGPAATNFYLRNSDGQIGIGNTSPSYKLDITGTLRSTGNTFLGTSSSEVYVNTTTDAGAYALQVSGSQYLSGSLSLGTTSAPLGTKRIRTAYQGGLEFEQSNGGVTASMSTYNTYDLQIENNNADIRLERISGKILLNPTSTNEVLINTSTDAGAYALQVAGAIYNTTTITTGAPSGGTAKPFKIGAAATVSPTSPNRTIEIEIDGTTYYIHAKTTND